MKGWNSRISWSIPRRCCIQPVRINLWKNGQVLLNRPLSAGSSLKNHSSTLGFSPFGVYESRLKPDLPHHSDLNAWITLLDGALPAHLRLQSDLQPSKTLSAVDLAEVLLVAQYPTNSFFLDVSAKKGIDLLFHLGFNQGRWDAVVWLVKSLVENLPYPRAKIGNVIGTITHWSGPKSLDEETAGPLQNYPVAQPGLSTLDEITDSQGERPTFEETLCHHGLGQIWRTLGTMTQACAGSDIRPEVLELIAYIHHQGFMPESVYRYSAHPDPSAIQQPPLLSLLSSRIFTSLSDAAWRAHERAVIATTKTRNGEDVSQGPELRGSVYRINVAGLRPEVWMELILWSSLHGGWLLHGFAILRALALEKAQVKWRPLSWQQYESQLDASSNRAVTDWESLDYLFKTRDTSTMDDPSGPVLQVERTVSAEVVNAYIDALVNSVGVGVGARGIAVETIIVQLHQMKTFLGRSKLSTSAGTWDALITRLIEYHTVVPEQDKASLQNLISLSTGIGQGLHSNNTQNLPSYVLDGNTLVHGLLHRALDGQVASEDLNGAMAVLQTLQTRNDIDKRKSLASFMNKLSTHLSYSESVAGMFSSNLVGIDYPALKSQIPPTVLGRFLNLITDAKAYDFGKWLLYSQDVDGPIIDARQYMHPALQPALLRFAVETSDKALIEKFKGNLVSMESLRSFLDSQVNLRRWHGVVRVLEAMKNMYHITWTAGNLASVAQKMVLQRRNSNADKASANSDTPQAKEIFIDMVTGKYDESRPVVKQHSIQTLLCVLSCIDSKWAGFCNGLRLVRGPVNFSLGTTAFNTILLGVAEAYGSATAKKLLETFWPASARQVMASSALSTDKRMSRQRRKVHETTERHRISLQLPGMTSEDAQIVILGALAPISHTFMIVLRKALEEVGTAKNGTSSSAKDAAATALDVVVWSLEQLYETRPIDSTTTEDLRRRLSEVGLELPGLMEKISRKDLLPNMDKSSVSSNEPEVESDIISRGVEAEGSVK